MIPGENFKLRTVPRFEVKARGYKFPGGTYSHGFCLNSNDQTVSIWDCSTDTVTNTVTLTSSKAFASAFYRSIDKSIYVLGANYFDRIDLDPDSGTFATVVESGTSYAAQPHLQSYLPYPIDGFIPGRVQSITDFLYLPVRFLSDYLGYSNRRHRAKNGRWNSLPPRFAHQNILSARYHPLNSMIEMEGAFFDVLINQNEYASDYKYNFKANEVRNGTTVGYGGNQLGQSDVCNYLFKNFMLLSTSVNTYVVQRRQTSYLHTPTMTHGCGSSGRFFYEYDPNCRRVMMQGKLATQGSVFELGNGVVTDLGDLSRAAYKATNEDGTDDMAFNPVHKKVYVQGRKHGSTGDAGIDKIHVYDLSQSLGSMYLGSITVGGNGGSVRGAAYALNTIGFNGNRYWESDHGI